MAAELLRELIGRLEEEPGTDVEAFLARHPAEAEELRRGLENLARHGLLACPGPGSALLGRLEERRVALSQIGGEAAAVVGRYAPGVELGRGGTSRVLLARDLDLRRDVALKLLEPGSVRLPPSADAVERFLAEARIHALLEHPGIAPVHELGLAPDGRLFLAMKRVEGRSLREVVEGLARGDAELAAEFPLRRRVELVERVAETLTFAHSRGVVHRDLKPANVMVGAFGEVLVMDWGLARSGSGDGRARGSDEEDWSATSTGDVFGTPSYMAPEQAAGRREEVDERTDVFGLGALLQHLLSGAPPYRGRTREEVLARATEGRRNDPELHDARERVPRELVAVCARAMAPRREARYASADELRRDLVAFREDRPGRAWRDGSMASVVKLVRRRPAGATAVAGVLLVLLMALVAVSSVREASRARADRANEVVMRALAEASTERPEQAVQTAERATSLAPLDPRAWGALGLALKQSGELTLAVPAMEHAEQLAADQGATDRSWNTGNLVNALLQLARWSEARAWLDRSRAAAPEDPVLEGAFASYLTGRGRWEHLLAFEERAFEAHPEWRAGWPTRVSARDSLLLLGFANPESIAEVALIGRHAHEREEYRRAYGMFRGLITSTPTVEDAEVLRKVAGYTPWSLHHRAARSAWRVALGEGYLFRPGRAIVFEPDLPAITELEGRPLEPLAADERPLLEGSDEDTAEARAEAGAFAEAWMRTAVRLLAAEAEVIPLREHSRFAQALLDGDLPEELLELSAEHAPARTLRAEFERIAALVPPPR